MVELKFTYALVELPLFYRLALVACKTFTDVYRPQIQPKSRRGKVNN